MRFNKYIRGVLGFFATEHGLLIIQTTTSLICNHTVVPHAISWSAEALGVCGTAGIQTEVSLPKNLFAPEMAALVELPWTQLPDTTAMKNCRLGLRSLLAPLAAIKTPQGKETLDFVTRFEEHSKQTIKSIDKFNRVAKRTAHNLIYNIEGLIDAIDRARSKPRNSGDVYQIMSFKQVDIDMWAENFQRDLRDLNELATIAQDDLDACDAINKQISTAAGSALANVEEHEEGKQRSREEIHAPVILAMESLSTVIKENNRAHEFLTILSDQLEKVIDGLQTTYRSTDEMRIINMGMEEQVEMTVDVLRKLRQGAQNGKLGQ